MKYRISVHRIPEEPNQDVLLDAVYQGDFDANEDMADEIGEQAGNCIEEAIRCDVAGFGEGES